MILRDWQAKALPLALASIARGDRGVVSAVMGSGKSVLIAAICEALPDLRVVVTTPKIRLVEQLAATIGNGCGTHYTHGKYAGERVVVACNASASSLPRDWDLWISDEAHSTESEQMKAVEEALRPRAAIGFTATPFRALRTEDLSLWSSLIVEYGAADAFRDGVCVRPTLVTWDGGETTIDEACIEMIGRMSGPGVANATSIRDAEHFAARLEARGIAATSIHSRLAAHAQRARLEALERGDVRCIVHVNMLSEGVDLPWLRWICLRRDVRSRVRFCQEVGRILRAYPGKTTAYLLDPNDLFDAFGLTYEAMLAGSRTEDECPETERLARELMDGDADAERPIEERMLRRLDAARRYTRRLHLSFVAAGRIVQKITSTHWRRFEPSPRQTDTVRIALMGLSRKTTIPIIHRRALAWVGDNAARLMRGDVSDLLSIGFAIRDAGWPELPDELASGIEPGAYLSGPAERA